MTQIYLTGHVVTTTSTPDTSGDHLHLSEEDTEQEESSGVDSNTSDIRIDPSNLINPIKFHWFLNSCDELLLEYIKSVEEEDDDVLPHLCVCHMNTPDRNPHWYETGSPPQINLLAATSITKFPTKQAMKLKLDCSATTLCRQRKIGDFVSISRSKTQCRDARPTTTSYEQLHHTQEPTRTWLRPHGRWQKCHSHRLSKDVKRS